jgi:DNA mismatch endonuclease (patch repair protein)
MVLPRYSAVIFVHGCYWHMHKCRFGKVKPKTNARFWQEKRISNLERDKRNIRALRSMGWKVLVIWECQIKDKAKLEARIEKFLS